VLVFFGWLSVAGTYYLQAGVRQYRDVAGYGLRFA
jgi:1,4-dihydroxy-2-naphthoate octaprenyltransferase